MQCQNKFQRGSGQRKKVAMSSNLHGKRGGGQRTITQLVTQFSAKRRSIHLAAFTCAYCFHSTSKSIALLVPLSA